MRLSRSYRFPIAILFLVGIVFLKYAPILIALSIFIIAFFFNNKTVKPLRNFRFWIIIAVLVLLVPVFTGDQDRTILGITYSSVQLAKTFLMTLRGVSVFILFQVITIDLNIDKIRPLFSRIGINNFDKLYDLSNDIFPKIKNILRARYNLFKMDWRKSKSLESLLIFVTDVFNDFFLLTDSLTRSNKSKYKTTPQDFVENYLNITENSLIVVTGDAGIGKTPWIEQVIDLLLENNKRVDGLISKKIVQSDEVWSHDLMRISNGDKRQLTTMDDIKTSTSMGKFNFYDESIAWGNAQLMAIDDPDHIIIDEIGLLEFEEQGLLPGLQHIFKHYDGTIILTIRHSLKNRIRDFLKSKLDMSRNWNFDIIEI